MDDGSTGSWDISADEFDGSESGWDESLWNDSAEARKKRRKFLRGDPPTIDWEHLRSRLRVVTADLKLDPVPRWFHVIDVEQRKVVRAPSEPFDYVCLSYTWGDAQEFQATRDSIFKLQEDGALDRPENPNEPEGPDNPRVPATIRDAITVCQHLGKKYLWVDRLCIVQDLPEKQLHFNEMGRIYNHAFVTIVAFEGRDARYGLHGVSRLINLSASDDDFWTRSEWLRRGWTYQEAILSRYMVIFAEDGIIVEHEGEATLTQKFEGPEHHQYLPMFHGAIDYGFAVENYTARKLGLQSDIVNGFSGICSHLFDKFHQFGVPKNDFDSAMHWFATDTRRKMRSSDENCIFPSWSWASVQGQISFPRFLPALAIASWAFVDTVDDHGNFSMSYPKPRNTSFQPEDHMLPALMHLAYQAYGFDFMPVKRLEALQESPHVFLDLKPKWPSISTGECVHAPTEREFIHEFPNYASFWEFCRGVDTGFQKPPIYAREFTERQKHLASVPGRILAHSWSSQNKEFRSLLGKGDFQIYDKHGVQLIGAGYFDHTEYLEILRKKRESIHEKAIAQARAQAQAAGKVGSEPLVLDVAPVEPLTLDFFVLSVSMMAEWQISKIFLPPNSPDYLVHLLNAFNDNVGEPLQNRVVATVIAIEEDPLEPGVFHRIGFGFINFKRFLEDVDRHRTTLVLA